ncbi:TIGR03087 family PEP-CTERM/XrtA system glycosyltransferase [Paraglaciecola chathamensis]|uniref:TIGR03087 family PEP-CTERM/XrtA system glycosyltransferase n=1 Tax=Paraglaciecola chathamensis TaxID=368405 RepID=UPI0026F828F8|nr:TIGR03087 family PEP-CTERM/XrtA system glycosyltransferase [Paraglaciecola chathamensis]MDO6558274.1 TIGR03087 family PEP-CTERM/XrtA system glycosyltransferase [Paraglaciecola chathamensis]MDO6838883.1 TIGR03087 family PEP-CTERM/XrtA system glycosyltransferase [Paraglaciecola chathamensis]
MNILFLSHRIPYPANKGEKIRTYHQIKYLKEIGHTVSVVAPYEDDTELAFFEELNNLHCHLVVGEKLLPKPYRILRGLLKRQSLSVANFYSNTLLFKLENILSERQFDAIICTASSMAEYIFRCKPSSLKTDNVNIALLMDFMDLDSDKWQQYAQKANPLMNILYKREAKKIAELESQTSKVFDTCFFITEAEKKLFLKSNPNSTNILSLQNGMDTELFKPSQTNKDLSVPKLLFTGVMDYAPNIDAVIWFVEKVWDLILLRWPDATFHIVGMSPTDKVLNLGQKKGLVVTGYVDDVLPYFDEANIFIAPFRIARGVQNKVLQAFACGLPVISTPLGAEGIRCESNKSILIANKSHEFVTHIEQLLNSDSHFHSIVNSALDIIHQHYAWHGVLAPLNEVLTSKKTVAIAKGLVK